MKIVIASFLLSFAVAAVAGDSRQRERHQQFSLPEEGGDPLVFDWQGGAWQYDNIMGEFRIVITESTELGANKLYVQWWRDLEEGKELGYSLAVAELNNAPAFSFSTVKCQNAQCSRFRIEAEHAHEGFKQNFDIELLSLGRYRLQL